jgi:hypothetical protein
LQYVDHVAAFDVANGTGGILPRATAVSKLGRLWWRNPSLWHCGRLLLSLA